MRNSGIPAPLQAAKQSGKRLIGCFPPYPPLELFHAMGLVPIVLWGLKGVVRGSSESDKHLQPYVCSVARHLMEFLLSGGGDLIDGLWMYNACDTLRNLPEILTREFSASGRNIPVFRTHIPMAPPRQTDSGQYFENEIRSLIGSIHGHFGASLSEEAFKASLGLYNRTRKLALEAEQRVAKGLLGFTGFTRVMQEGWLMPVEEHMAALEALLDSCGNQPETARNNGGSSGVLVSGILPPPELIISAIESSGLTVVGNDIASLRRSYSDIHDTPTDPVGYYKKFYYGHYPCPTLLYMGDSRFERLMNLIRRNDARGVVFVGEKFCEYEYFEFPYMQNRLREKGIHSLTIEVATNDASHTSAQISRIEAFAEMIHAMPHSQSPRIPL
jgi:benzoyl-CoA reductase/2-hydroxyglutaryl-CoA dehydratase subunit BcrC/BadD/HgdB